MQSFRRKRLLYKMDLLTTTTAVVFALAITKFLPGDADRINCENVYFGELNQLSLIDCQVDGPKMDVYWFKGNVTTIFPIISLEEGTVEWGNGYSDKYDLTEDHMLKIINTDPEDEGAYTVRIYFDEFDHETVTTELKVYSEPADPCVQIDSCDPNCDDCRLNVTGTGELMCKVYGSRPLINLEWIVTNQSGISFLLNKQVDRYDDVSLTYDTTITITYTTDGCGGSASLYCNGSVSDHLFVSILDVYSRNVRIFSDTCQDIIPDTLKPPSEGARGFVLLIIILAVVFLLLIFPVVCFILWRKGLSRRPNDHDDYMELAPSYQQPPRQPSKAKDVKKELIEALIRHYEQYCFVKPLPWGEPIPINALYTAYECTVTTTKNKTSHHTSEHLSTRDFDFDNKRVLITADLGYGKTTFTQHLVATWISHQTVEKGKKSVKTGHCVLIYIHLKEVTRTTILSEFVQRMLPAGINLTCNDIEQIFQNNECHILLDGLDELSMSFQVKATPEESSDDTPGLKIGNLLDNQINMNTYKQLKVWVTSREVDNMKSEFSLPYSKVKMLGFSQQQIFDYIHKTCKYYYEQKHIPEMALFDHANADSYSDNVKSSKAQKKLSTKVEEPTSDMQKVSEDVTEPQNDSYVDIIDEIKEDRNELHFGNGITEEEIEEISAPTSFTKLLEDDKQESNKLPPDGESNESKRKKDEISTEKENKATSVTSTSEIDKKDHEVSGQLRLLVDNVINFIEVNDVINIFSNTPLLQIMIIHVITCRILDPTGRYKEMNINKLTTIIRLVITCLESRYVQKVQKDSIKPDIKSLENKLGEMAFKNKLKVTLGKEEFWESELGKQEDVKTALEIGLLKYSKSAGSGGIQLEQLAFSSHSGIEFYHEFFKEYLAAQYISENKTKWKWLDEFIKGSGDEATVRLLQFMFGMDNPKVDKAFQTLVNEKKMWNNLIDCINEVGDPEKKRSMIFKLKDTNWKKGILNVNLNINYLDRKHHSVAVTDFCKACNEHEINISRMTFREACAIDFVKEVTLPSLEFLIFFEMNINETQFVSILTSSSVQKRAKVLLFVACEVPKTLFGKDLTRVTLAMKENEKMKIYKLKTISQANVTVPVFNCQKGTWGTAFFPKHF